MPIDLSWTITLEGAATALGVLGAAAGYLITLVSNRRREAKRQKYVGTRLLMMELLERNIETGLTEDRLWNLYCAPESGERRLHYNSWPPEKLTRIMFEREIRQLQFDHQVDVAGPDLYRIRAHPFPRDDAPRPEETLAKDLATSVTIESLREPALRLLADTKDNRWRRTSALRHLLELGDDESVAIVKGELINPDPELALQAAEVIDEFLKRHAGATV